MWINCLIDPVWNTELRFSHDDNAFCIECKSSCSNVGQNSEIYAFFYNESGERVFEIGAFANEDDGYRLSKKYSRSYLASGGIELCDLLYFIIVFDENTKIKAYPDNGQSWRIDSSIIRAKEVLASVKDNKNYEKEASDAIEYINNGIKLYEKCTLPFLAEFDWYNICDMTENFGISSIEHVLRSTGVTSEYSSWYLGVSQQGRVYAVALKGQNNKANPLSNANDCTLMYTDSENKCVYYVVGIMLLDDGQYFCRLN